MAKDSVGDIRKTSKDEGTGEPANRRWQGAVEQEDGEGKAGTRAMSAGTSNSGKERSVPGTNHAIETTCVPTKSIPNSMSGGDQQPSPATSNTVLQQNEARSINTAGRALRSPKFVRKRPASAAAAVTSSASATNNKERDVVSQASLTAPGKAAFESHHKNGGRTSRSSPGGGKGGTRPREVPICWEAETMPGRRPKPLGKTNTSKIVIKVQNISCG